MPVLHQGAHQGGAAAGASQEELMEAIWVAAEMRAGAAYAHSILAIDTMEAAQSPP